MFVFLLSLKKKLVSWLCKVNDHFVLSSSLLLSCAVEISSATFRSLRATLPLSLATLRIFIAKILHSYHYVNILISLFVLLAFWSCRVLVFISNGWSPGELSLDILSVRFVVQELRSDMLYLLIFIPFLVS